MGCCFPKPKPATEETPTQQPPHLPNPPPQPPQTPILSPPPPQPPKSRILSPPAQPPIPQAPQPPQLPIPPPQQPPQRPIPQPPKPPTPQPPPPPPQQPLPQSPRQPAAPPTIPTKSPSSPPPLNPLPKEPPTIEELFDKVNAVFVDSFIVAMENFLDGLETKSKEGKRVKDFVTPSGADKGTTNSISVWDSVVEGGKQILEFVSKQLQPKGDVASQLVDARQAVAVILQSVAKLHWVVGMLSIIAYLLVQIGQVSDNKVECIKLLKQMLKLARHIRKLNNDMPEEAKRFNDAILMIFEGSIMCATLLKSEKFFSFLSSSVDSEKLSSLRSDISHLYDDLNLTVVEKIFHEQAISRPQLQPRYPDNAVGIQDPKNQVIKELDLTTKMESSLSVVIYGIGGVGKTTLANAVIAGLNLKDYNYTGVEIHEDFHKKDFMNIQQQILKDAFPEYENGRSLTLRNSAEGLRHLSMAFQCNENKPVFVFIDNARRAEDLQDIFPSDLRGLPRRSRILVTTRKLDVTDMLESAGLERRYYQLNALPKELAKEILLKRARGKVEIKKHEMDNIVRVCGGIPLLLEIVGARLHRQGYRANNCTQIVEALEEGANIKEENATKRLFDFVYNELEESTQQAFLDICCFFTNWSRRNVEYVLGPEQVTLLQDAALVKASSENVLIVHDVIRKIGIRKSEGSRISDLQALEEAVKDEKVSVKGVWLREDEDETEHKYEFKGALLSSMKTSLRVLALGSRVRVPERIQKKFKLQELRFLQISGGSFLPVDLESLERLGVYHGPICVEGVNFYQLPRKLRALKAAGQSDCTNLSTQWRASQSMQIPPNSSLEELDLQELKSLQSLPDRLDHLTGLHILLLDDCRFQSLPDQICRLPSLVELKLTGCTNLTELPESFTQLTSLEILNLERCWKLEALPSSFGKLKMLNKLSLQSNALKELPSNFGELRSLTELKCNCTLLQELPDIFEQFRSLTKLDLSLCIQVRSLPPSIEKLSLLKDFNLVACWTLQELPSKVVELPALKTLNLWKCDSLKQLPPSAYKGKGKELTIILPDHLQKKRP